ncbi:RusA family crossover junction endodeoxyribonuclease [Aliidiomarina sp. Khilg15.8]
MKKYAITPVPKPRMTQRDRFRLRPPVARYRAFCDEVRLRKVNVPAAGAHILFVLPMPKSWSKLKRQQQLAQPHLQKPDTDNLVKAVLDAVHNEDQGIWDIRGTKVWGHEGQIIIRELAAPVIELE